MGITNNHIPLQSDWSDDEYNHNRVFADNLLTYLLKPNPHTDAQDIADAMGRAPFMVKATLQCIRSRKPDMITLEEISTGSLKITDYDRTGVEDFLKDGGVTRQEDEKKRKEAMARWQNWPKRYKPVDAVIRFVSRILSPKPAKKMEQNVSPGSSQSW
jgi:O-methyltransferase involved in polyketide biosynthesis